MNLPGPVRVRRDVPGFGLCEARGPGVAVERSLDAEGLKSMRLGLAVDYRHFLDQAFAEKIHQPPRVGLLRRMKSIIPGQEFAIGSTGVLHGKLVSRPGT